MTKIGDANILYAPYYSGYNFSSTWQPFSDRTSLDVESKDQDQRDLTIENVRRIGCGDLMIDADAKVTTLQAKRHKLRGIRL